MTVHLHPTTRLNGGSVVHHSNSDCSYPLPQMEELRRCYPRTRDNEGSDEVNRNLILGIP
jgi:hypothetical protein